MRSYALLAAILALGVSAAALAAETPKLKPMVLTAGASDTAPF